MKTKRLVTVTWSHTVEIEMDTLATIDDFESFRLSPELSKQLERAQKYAYQNISEKTGIITDIRDY